MPGRPARSAATSAPCPMSPARLVFTSSDVGFMRARSAAVTMPRVAGTRAATGNTFPLECLGVHYPKRSRSRWPPPWGESSGPRHDPLDEELLLGELLIDLEEEQGGGSCSVTRGDGAEVASAPTEAGGFDAG
jgi:hypothetical protein